MPSGPGYWLDLTTETLHLVTTHNDWLLDSVNQQAVKLQPDQIEVLRHLDPIKEIDEIRMIGVLHGLVRIRDYRSRVSIQFLAVLNLVGDVLKAVFRSLPQVTDDKFAYLTIQNLLDDSTAAIDLPDLQNRLILNEPVLIERDRIEEHEILRQKVAGLLEWARVESKCG